MSERKRQWEVREALKTMNQKLAFVTSDNPAAAGRFMELYMEYRRMSFRERNGQCNYVNFARRMRLPALHFQLDDHIPTMASYQTSTISLGVQPPPMAVSRTTSSLELRLRELFEESELVSGDSEAIRKFSDKYIVPVKLVAEYVRHLAQIKMRKE